MSLPLGQFNNAIGCGGWNEEFEVPVGPTNLYVGEVCLAAEAEVEAEVT